MTDELIPMEDLKTYIECAPISDAEKIKYLLEQIEFANGQYATMMELGNRMARATDLSSTLLDTLTSSTREALGTAKGDRDREGFYRQGTGDPSNLRLNLRKEGVEVVKPAFRRKLTGATVEIDPVNRKVSFELLHRREKN